MSCGISLGDLPQDGLSSARKDLLATCQPEDDGVDAVIQAGSTGDPDHDHDDSHPSVIAAVVPEPKGYKELSRKSQ